MENTQLSNLLGYVETRQWNKAWPEFERLLEQGPPTAFLVLLGSHVAFGQNDYFRAKQLAERALAAWNQAEPIKVLGQIRFHLGMVTRAIGDSFVAKEQFQQFLADLSKYPELAMGEGKAHFYLGLTYRERREYEAALAAYHQASDCFRRDGLPSLLCKTLHNLAWLYCLMNRSQDAKACLAEAHGLCNSPELDVHQALGEAFLAYLEGRHSLASELCQSIFQRVERNEPITPKEQSQAAWIAGSVALAEGYTESATALANAALQLATEAQDSRLMNDANNLRRSILLGQQAGA